MATSRLIFALCFFMCKASAEVKDVNNKTDTSSRTARFNYPEYAENRLPSTLNFQEHGPYSDRQGYYKNEKHLSYEVPSGFHEFIPDKTSGPKYTYGPSDFYPPNFEQDFSPQEIKDRVEMTTKPSISGNLPSRINDLFQRAVKFFFGMNDPDSVLIDEKPTLVTVFKQIFKDPVVALAAIIVPVSFLLINVISFMTKLVTGSSMLSNLVPNLAPVVTSTIANTVARGLENPAAGQILEVIDEFGSKAVADPKCLQRLFCQAAKSDIESRSADSFSIQGIMRKLAKAVDEKMWGAFGLNLLFTSLQSGHCDVIPCSFDFKSSSGISLLDKLKQLFSKLFNITETQHL